MVVVQVHEGKDLVDALLGRVLVRRELDHLARHVVDRLDDLEHLVVRDEAVVVDVVQLERPCGHELRGCRCVSAGTMHHYLQRVTRNGEGRPAGALDKEGGTADAHWSFSSSLPRLVMDKAAMNSLKSIVPLLFLSAHRVAGRVSAIGASKALLAGRSDRRKRQETSPSTRRGSETHQRP